MSPEDERETSKKKKKKKKKKKSLAADSPLLQEHKAAITIGKSIGSGESS